MDDETPLYTIEVTSHRDGKRFKLELFSNYYTPPRRYVIRVNGKLAEKVPCASKTTVLDLIRRWLVSH